MKTLLTRMKTVVQDNANLDYVKEVRIVAPKTLPPLSQDNIPFIGLAPMNSPEIWVAQKKEVTHTIEAYLVIWYPVAEYSIIGSDDYKGILDLETDFKNAVRNNFFASGGTNYLSKPTNIISVDRITEPYGDDFYLLIATVTLECIRLFIP